MMGHLRAIELHAHRSRECRSTSVMHKVLMNPARLLVDPVVTHVCLPLFPAPVDVDRPLLLFLGSRNIVVYIC